MADWSSGCVSGLAKFTPAHPIHTLVKDRTAFDHVVQYLCELCGGDLPAHNYCIDVWHTTLHASSKCYSK